MSDTPLQSTHISIPVCIGHAPTTVKTVLQERMTAGIKGCQPRETITINRDFKSNYKSLT